MMKLECVSIKKLIRIVRKVTKKTLIISIGCFMSLLIFIYITHTKLRKQFVPSAINFSNINTLMYMGPQNPDGFYDEHETIEEIIEGDRNIFFLETSHINQGYEIKLNIRQGCAVESAARMNPTMKVYLFIFNRKSWNYLDKTKDIVMQLKSYKNIGIRHIDLETYFKNSPMDEWWQSTNSLSSSHWFTSHVSDILRYLTLWKFSGIYLDLDVVIKSSLEHLKVFAAAQDSSLVASGALGFDETEVGRRYANACLFEIISDFHGDDWEYNGPGVITRTLKKICSIENIAEMTPARCGGFKVFPPSAFYPIHWKDWKQYFDIPVKNETMKAIENALAIHVWNRRSYSTPIDVGSGEPYELIAEKYCPRVYGLCGRFC